MNHPGTISKTDLRAQFAGLMTDERMSCPQGRAELYSLLAMLMTETEGGLLVKFDGRHFTVQ